MMIQGIQNTRCNASITWKALIIFYMALLCSLFLWHHYVIFLYGIISFSFLWHCYILFYMMLQHSLFYDIMIFSFICHCDIFFSYVSEHFYFVLFCIISCLAWIDTVFGIQFLVFTLIDQNDNIFHSKFKAKFQLMAKSMLSKCNRIIFDKHNYLLICESKWHISDIHQESNNIQAQILSILN